MPAPLARLTQRRLVLFAAVVVVGAIGAGLVFGSEPQDRNRAARAAVKLPAQQEKQPAPPARSTPPARPRTEPRPTPPPPPAPAPPARPAPRESDEQVLSAADDYYAAGGPLAPYEPDHYGFPSYKPGGEQTQAAPPPPPDRTRPRIVISRRNRVIRVGRNYVFIFLLRPFDEDVAGSMAFSTARRVTVGATSAAKRKKRRIVIARKRFSARAGRRVRLRVKVNKRGRRVLRRAKRVRIRARIAVIDAAANRRNRTYRFTLKAPKRKRKKR